MDADTIFAVASGAGHAAIAVMRLSGPASFAVLAALCGRVPPPRRASFRRLRDATGRNSTRPWWCGCPDQAATPARTLRELYLHGGRAVLHGVADALVALRRQAGRSRANSPAAPS